MESSIDNERAEIPATLAGLTVTRKVEQFGHLLGASVGVAGVGEPTLRIAELIEERVAHCVNRRKTLGWRVLKERRDQLDGIIGCLAEDLLRHQTPFSCYARIQNQVKKLPSGMDEV